MVLKITNLHILRYLSTCWLYLLERYTIDNQRCIHTASASKHMIISILNLLQSINMALFTGAFFVAQVSLIIVDKPFYAIFCTS